MIKWQMIEYVATLLKLPPALPLVLGNETITFSTIGQFIETWWDETAPCSAIRI